MILCAGTSKRFGSNKMLAHLAGKPLLAHTIGQIRPQVSELALNGEGREYDGFDLPVFSDAIVGKLGPLAGVLTAMVWAKGKGYSRVLTMSGDAPFVPNNWAEKLAETPAGEIALPRVEGRSHQVCGLWSTSILPNLRAFLQAGDSYKVRDFLQIQTVQYVDFSTQNDVDPFFNVNTREDMEIAEKVLERRE